MKSLAVKYRPKTFDGVTEQSSVTKILKYQIDNGLIKNGYLFCGGAGTGKTTMARIFANEINHGEGSTIELDAASNNSVDNIRDITEQARIKSLDSEYKVFILDECHALSSQAWQAMLKTLEEPPAKSIFIFCTTNPEKIPQTILSRVQRFNFQRISMNGIVTRLQVILQLENNENGDLYTYTRGALEIIAKLANGGMRDAITMLDKCLGYSDELTEEVVNEALNTVDYDVYIDLLQYVDSGMTTEMVDTVHKLYRSGADMRAVSKELFEFVTDLVVYIMTDELGYTKIPNNYKGRIDEYDFNKEWIMALLTRLEKMNYKMKNESNAMGLLIATLLIFMWG